MKIKMSHWMPMAFCAALSFICLVTIIAVSASSSANAWTIPFLCFLPMCFFMAASVTVRMQQEIDVLRKQVADLQIPR